MAEGPAKLTTTATSMTAVADAAKALAAASVDPMVELARALQFGDSALPTGAFSFSHGLESALERGVVTDPATLKAFVRAALEQASATDVVALQEAYKAALDGALDRIAAIDRFLFNRKLNEEPRAMTARTGKKLVETAARITRAPIVKEWLALVASGKTPGAYSVSFAVVFVGVGSALPACVVAHQYGLAAAILSAALRLMRIDHFETQRILFELNGDIADDFAMSSRKALSDIASFTPVFDVLAAVHVEARVRLFMS